LKRGTFAGPFILCSALIWASSGVLPRDAEAPASPNALSIGRPAIPQFTAEELGERAKWEEFLKSAEVIDQRQLTKREAVTNPWVLTLKKDDVTHRALWKNAQGRMQGYIEGWQWEIAAYLLDKHLGLNMVPPTVERRFREERGSCQFWIDDCISLRDKEQKKLNVPSYRVFFWNRATYLQRFWDNLIANEDRHQNQILITPDWRMILIDHSRSFRTGSRFTKNLIYTERHREGPKLMSELPRALVDKIRGLDLETLKLVTEGYLTDTEIEAVLLRRDLIVKEIERLVGKYGEDKVLYVDPDKAPD
jgi:hypothetical protein